MPLARIALLRGKSPTYLRALADGVQAALVETFGVPPADRFQLIQQFDPGELIYDASYLGMRRDDDVVVVDITVSDWRETAAKAALYRAIADRLASDPGVSPENLVIVLSPNTRADWSFGRGVASYVHDQTAA